MSRKHRRGNSAVTALLTVLIVLMIACTGLVVWLCLDMVNGSPNNGPGNNLIHLPQNTDPQVTETEPTETTMPEPEHVVATATIGAMGDLLMHMPVIDTCNQGGGTYNFESIFRYIKDDISSLDYAVANLETTLCGTDNGYTYKGYPNFNCPDSIVDGAKEAGFDTLLTANNHSYDTSMVGYKRTIEVVRAAGLGNLGTMMTAEEPKYMVEDINGIQVGMVCYTYGVNKNGKASLNGNAPMSEAGLVNYFDYANLSGFYTEIEGYLKEMKAAGAEATVVFIHWGVEYQLYANDKQKAIAQTLCDMGVDVIIGGHPHVLQPMDLLTSTTDPDHKTAIIYSLGNAVSNQRQGKISSISTAHTEDGALFTVTFEKYSDGTVYLAGVDVIPTWVNLSNVNGKQEYNILPLADSRRDEWQSAFNLTDALTNKAQNSYARTQSVIGEGLAKCQEWLAQAKAEREAYYYDLAFFPEKFAQTATSETVPETFPESTETTLPNAA